MWALIIFGIIVVLIIWFFVSQEFYNVAVMKGYPQKKYFFITFFFGIIGALLIIALPNQGSIEGSQVIREKGNVFLKNSNDKNTPSAKAVNTSPKGIIGKCQLCDKDDVEIFNCKIVDDMGTRYRSIYKECINKTNAEIENN